MERARVLEGEGRGIREGGNGEKVPQLAMFDLLLAFLFAIQLSKLLRFFYFLMWILKSHVFYKTSTTFFLFFEKNMIQGLV
jgi:hypothetical protein